MLLSELEWDDVGEAGKYAVNCPVPDHHIWWNTDGTYNIYNSGFHLPTYRRLDPLSVQAVLFYLTSGGNDEVG